MRHASGITSGHEHQDRRRRRNRPRDARAAMLVVAVALALVAAAGCTRDVTGTGRNRRSAERPVQLADVRLLSARSCDDLLAAAEQREQAVREQIERWEGPTTVYDDDMAGAGAVAGPVPDAPVTTAASMPSTAPTAADSARPGAAERTTTGESGGTVVAGTNNQEQGVDEGDLAKTDGRVLVTLPGDGILRVVVLDDSPQVDATVPLDDRTTSGGGSYGVSGQLMLRGTSDGGRELVAVRSTYSNERGIPVVDIARIDLTDPAAPVVAERARVAGELVATRMIGGVGRIVIRPTLGTPIVEPAPIDPVPSTTEPPVPSTTEPVTSSTTITTTTTEPSDDRPDDEQSTIPEAAAALLPQRLTDDGDSIPLGGCDDVLSVPATSPIDPSGGWAGTDGIAADVAYPSTSGATVLTVGPTLGDLSPVTIEGGAETVYAGTDALYTTSTTWSPTATGGDSVTAVHRFDLTGDGSARYTGSGLVPGRLLDQYSLSDRDGALRVVTTAQTSSTAGRIAVLRPGGDGTLREVGHLDDLGLGEEVKSVRFVEDRAYVVTFRQTDPLFAVDMSGDAPVLLGELKIPGFSEYLHPIGDGRLLGIGADADPQTGQVTGFKASLFDVSDPTRPVELDSFTEADAASTVGQDPHAFTWDPVRSQAVVPVTIQPSTVRIPVEDTAVEPPGPLTELPAPPTTVVCPPNADCSMPSGPSSTSPVYPAPRNVAWVVGVDGDRLVLRGTITHDLGGSTDQILRSLVVDSTIWTVSDRAIGRSDATAPTATSLVRF